ncbi:MAG TPA: hypothetical protein VE153_23400 [Myxococcus sp.]|nr:hypothetical protein [Myxococcus sp.]
MATVSRLAVRIPALLFSVAVVGGLIGFSWEEAMYGARAASTEAEWELPVLAEEEPPPELERTPAEEAILQRALSHFPPYPRASRPAVLAADYLGAGVPMAVAWFSTEDPPAQVLEHYARALLAAGLPIARQAHGKHGGYVGYWSPDAEEVRLVSVLAQGGETLVFVSAGQVKALLERAAPVPGWVPLPAQLSESRALTFDMEGASHHMVSGHLREATLEEAETGYRAALREGGWQVGETAVEASGIGFTVDRGSVSGRAVLRERASPPGVEVQLSLLQREGAP